MADEKAIVKKDEGALITAADMFTDAQNNSGFETIGVDDISIPFISILQALSPQCRGETKIEGAKEGDLFNTVSSEIYPSGIKLISCAYKKAYIEWKTRDSGGGFVAEHPDSSILEKTTKDSQNRDMLPNGNVIVTTAYHYCVILKADNSIERAVIAFSSTQLKKSRKWNSQMMALNITGPNGEKIRPPMYSHTYIANTVLEKNERGEWSGWNIGSPELITDMNLYKTAKGFSVDVQKGVVKATPKAEHTEEVVGGTVEQDNNVL